MQAWDMGSWQGVMMSSACVTHCFLSALRVTMLEEELKGASVDVNAIEEWRRKDAEYRGRLADLDAATQARNQVTHPCRSRVSMYLSRLHACMPL